MILIMLLSMFFFPKMDTLIVNKTLEVGQNDTLYVSLENGDVNLVGTKDNRLVIQYLLIYPRNRKSSRPVVNIGKFPHKIAITEKVKKPNRYASARLVIYLPENAVVIAISDNGDIKISDVRGKIIAQSTNGDIEFRRVGGILSMRCVNGDITGAIDTPDSVALYSSNGSIYLKIGAENPLINVEVFNGKVYSDLLLNETEGKPIITITASNGDVYISKK